MKPAEQKKLSVTVITECQIRPFQGAELKRYKPGATLDVEAGHARELEANKRVRINAPAEPAASGEGEGGEDKEKGQGKSKGKPE